MISQKRIKANRLNAQKSTGPRTKEGKAIVGKNAVTHGLFSSETLLPWEKSEDLELLRQTVTASLCPECAFEGILVDRIISILWRLRRIGKVEVGIYAWRKYSLLFDAAFTEYKSSTDPRASFPDLIEILSPAITKEEEEKQAEAKRDLCEKSTLVNSELPALGRTFVGDSQVFATLSRYERSLEKSLYQALNALQQMRTSVGSPSTARGDRNSGKR